MAAPVMHGLCVRAGGCARPFTLVPVAFVAVRGCAHSTCCALLRLVAWCSLPVVRYPGWLWLRVGVRV